ncbi:MAG TPA: hypothetical protein VFP50_07050, partial [Anaeromyxobacteraceae bacterium]|nr:hypothetical protein [Anaeromyxobacteraceae bacterium]
QGARATGLELARLLAVLAWVAGATAVAIAGLGALPGWLAGDTADARTVASVDEAERRLGARLALPSYFPERLAWPPTTVRVAGRRGAGGASLRLSARDGAGPAVELVQAVAPNTPIPPQLLGEPVELGASRALVGARPAVRARVLLDGAAWEELRWERDGRAMILRTQGDVEELFRMARSAHRQGAP